MVEKNAAKNTQGSTRRTSATKGFTEEERAAMKERARELKVHKKEADQEADVLAHNLAVEITGKGRLVDLWLHTI